MRALLLVSLVVGCASDPPLEEQIAIDQGAYGVIGVTSDTGGDDERFANAAVAAYANGNRIASARSDADGVYELPLTSGTYVVCVLDAPPEKLAMQYLMNCAGPCTQLVVPAGVVRADWSSNLSGGWWSEGDHCPRD